MYTLNIGDLPVNAEMPALKPIRVIHPIPNGKYLEHTIINIKTEGDKIIVDIPQIELRTINGINSTWSGIYNSDFARNNYIGKLRNDPAGKWVVCIEFFLRGASKRMNNNNVNDKHGKLTISCYHPNDEYIAKIFRIQTYGWKLAMMLPLNLQKSQYVFDLKKLRWRSVIPSPHTTALKKVLYFAKRHGDSFFEKVKKSMYVCARASIKSICTKSIYNSFENVRSVITNKYGYCSLNKRWKSYVGNITTHCTSCNKCDDYVGLFIDHGNASRNILMKLHPSLVDGFPGVTKCFIDEKYIDKYILKI